LQRQRARLEQEKVEKRALILSSAEKLFMEQEHFNSISVSSIADNLGFGKGTIYLYFRTKEEIYLALLEREFNTWLNNIITGLKTNFGKISSEKTIDILTGYISTHSYFMRLATISASILEKNISNEKILSYKAGLAEKILEAGSAIDEKVSGIEPGKGSLMLMRSYGIITGLWSLLEPPKSVKSILEENNLLVFKLDFLKEAKETLLIFWKGSIGN
jgi:AcrR family transcriptional regulator